MTSRSHSSRQQIVTTTNGGININGSSSPTNTIQVWVTQGKTEHLAHMYEGTNEYFFPDDDSDEEEEIEHVMVRWNCNNETEYVPLKSVRLIVDGEPRRRRGVQPIYTVELPKTKKSQKEKETKMNLRSNDSNVKNHQETTITTSGPNTNDIIKNGRKNRGQGVSSNCLIHNLSCMEPSLQSERSASSDDDSADTVVLDQRITSNNRQELSTSPSSYNFDRRLTIKNYDISDGNDFPTQLFCLLRDAKELSIDHILSWESDGKTFRIFNDDTFLMLLTRLSNNTKVISFRNTLGKFHFQCIDYGNNGRAYQHISAFPPGVSKTRQQPTQLLFHRDALMEDIQQICRRPRLSESIGNQSSASKTTTETIRSLRATTKAATTESLEKLYTAVDHSMVGKRPGTVPEFVATDSLQNRFRVTSSEQQVKRGQLKNNKTNKKRKVVTKTTKVGKRSSKETNQEKQNRRLSNGCLLPKPGSTYQLDNKTWTKPCGNPPNGLLWDNVRGLWAPKVSIKDTSKPTNGFPKCSKHFSKPSNAFSGTNGSKSRRKRKGKTDVIGKRVKRRTHSTKHYGRKSAIPWTFPGDSMPHRLAIQAGADKSGGGHSIDERLLEDHSVVRLFPCGKHHTLRSSPFFPTFLDIFKRKHAFKGKFTAKTKANPTGTIGGDNQVMMNVNKDNFAKIHELLLHREQERVVWEDDESSSCYSLDSFSSVQSVPLDVPPTITAPVMSEDRNDFVATI